MRVFSSTFLVALAIVSISYNSAMACPKGQYSSFGMCLPEIGGSLGAATEHLKKEIPAQLGGNPLEGWINASRNSAVSTSQPIPFQIRQALTGYIDDGIMNIARFKIGDNGIFNAASLTLRYGDADAITLVDVIVFRNASDAYNNPALWAHELTHVKQYRDWGTHSFAIQYARDYDGVEAPAYAVGNGFNAWRASNPMMTGGSVQPGTGGIPIGQAGFGNWCTTQFGKFGPGPTNPLGSQCSANTPQGIIFGRVTM